MEVDSDATGTQLKHSPTFNFADADVVFQSSDKVLFHVHIANLEFGSDGFPPVTIKPEQDEIVNLTEDSKTLDLLFRFVYPRLLPDLENLEFNILARLAEAVEKYQVHMGRKQCNLFMAQKVGKHSLAVLNYAIKHNYPALANSAAPNLKLSQIGNKNITTWVSRELLDLWLPYYYRWTEVVRTTTERYITMELHRQSDAYGQTRCNRWLGLQRTILAALATATAPDWTIWRTVTISEESPQCCLTEAKNWRSELAAKLKELPPFMQT